MPPPPETKLSTDFLPPEALERSKAGNKFEKVKCTKPGDVMWSEVPNQKTQRESIFLKLTLENISVYFTVGTLCHTIRCLETKHCYCCSTYLVFLG